jgi:hypothetical protein
MIMKYNGGFKITQYFHAKNLGPLLTIKILDLKNFPPVASLHALD